MTTIPAGRGSFVVSSPDTALRKRIASSCQPEVTAIWFPVLPGTTDLPISPEPIINANPEAPNSVEAPIGFNPEDPDLCALFNDILPISSPPVYPVEQTVELLSAPYIETVLVPTITRTRIGITSINYPLSVDGGPVSLVTKTILGLSNLYIAAEKAVFGFTGNEAVIQRRQTITPERGYFFSTGSAATFSLFSGITVPAVNCSIQALIPRTIPNNNTEILLPVVSIIITGAAGRVAIGGGVRVPAPVNITIAREIPSVGGGEVIIVPATNVSIATLLPTQIGRPVIFVSVPTVDINIAKPLPIISRSATIAVPLRETIISVHVPEISTVTIEVLVPALNVNISTAIPEVFVTGADVSVPAVSVSITPQAPTLEGVYGNILINVPSAGVSIGAPQVFVSPYREVSVPEFGINVSAVAPTVSTGKLVFVPIKTIFATAPIPSNVGLFIGSVEAAVAIGTRAPLLGSTTVTPPLPYPSFGGLDEQAWTDWEVLKNKDYFKVLPGGGASPVNTQYQSYISNRDVPYGPGAFPFQVIVDGIGHNWVTLMDNNLLAFNTTSDAGPSYYEWTGYPSIEPGENAKIWFGGRYVTGSMISNGAIFPNDHLRIYHKRETVRGIQVERFRYEGFQPTGYAGYGEPVDWKDNQLATEITFCQPFSDGRQVIEVRFGSQKLETDPTRPKDYFLINNASNAFAYARDDNITANSSWVFIGNSTGTQWTLTPNRYVRFDFDAQIYVPSTEVGVSGGVPLIAVIKTEVLVPAANISIATPEPLLSTPKEIEAPSAPITIGAGAPYIELDTYFSSIITQVYQWDREFMVDWWGD